MFVLTRTQQEDHPWPLEERNKVAGERCRRRREMHYSMPRVVYIRGQSAFAWPKDVPAQPPRIANEQRPRLARSHLCGAAGREILLSMTDCDALKTELLARSAIFMLPRYLAGSQIRTSFFSCVEGMK